MISSETSRMPAYVGDGSADTFAYTFPIFAAADLMAVVIDADKDETELVLDTDYTVSGVGEAAGGNVALIGAGTWLDAGGDLDTGYSLIIRRRRAILQDSDVRNQGDFFPEIHEDFFDHIVMVCQQQQDEIDRSVKLPDSVNPSLFDARLPSDIADNPGAALVVNDDGDGLMLGASSVDVARYFNSETYAALKVLAVAAPTVQRWGWATDIKQLMFYSADLTVGDEGWFPVGG